MHIKKTEQAADTHLNNTFYICDELISVSRYIDKSRYLDFLLLVYGFYYGEFQKISSTHSSKLDKELLWMCFSHCVISTLDNTYIDKKLFYITIQNFNRYYRYAKINTFDKNALKLFRMGIEFYRSAGLACKVSRLLRSPQVNDDD